MAALILALIFARRSPDVLPGLLPRSPVILALIGLLFFGSFGTALTNTDSLAVGGGLVLQAMTLYDGVSLAMNTIVGLLPFLIARKYLATPESHRMLLIVMVVAGFGYSMLALYEIRMSPQLNRMVYGYFPHDWRQHVRDGGFRPVVFLNHALWLAIFLSCCALAAFSLWRIAPSKWRKYCLFAGIWLVVTLVLAKNFGSIVITFVLLPLVLLLPIRLQILAAAALAGTLTFFPMLRAAGLVPVDTVVSTLAKVAPERIGSLTFRLEHEDILLEKAKQRPVFGWGGYDRGRVFDEEGRDQSVTDGAWIIAFSQGGWVRYVGQIGLLTFAIFILAIRWRRYELDPATAALSLVLAANLVDMIPNATNTSVTLLMAGALAGRLEVLTQAAGAGATSGLPLGAAAGASARLSGTGRTSRPGQDEAVPETGEAEEAPAGPRFTRFPTAASPRQRMERG
jgi:hypothetical protein